MTIRSSLIAATAAALLVAGCASKGGANGTVVAEGGGATVTKGADGSTTVATGDGTASISDGASVTMPAGLPAYPTAQGAQGIDLADATPGTAAHTVSFTTADPEEQVLGFYTQAAGRAGMRNIHREALGRTTRLMMEKGNEAVWVATRATDGTTQVSVSSGPR